MKNLKPTNRYRNVLVENIVFLQGDDYDQYVEEKFENTWEDEDFNDIEYLLQWYYPNEHGNQCWHSVKGLNTGFLGNLIKIADYPGYFLFTKNTHLGYIGLSRVIEFSMKIID